MAPNSKRIPLGERLFGPLVTPSGALFVLFVTSAAAGLLTWTDRSLMAQLQLNSTSAMFASLELKHEVGPDLALARTNQAHLIRCTMERMERGSMSLVGFFRSDLSPQRQLAPAIDVLCGTEKSRLSDIQALEQARVILAQAGKSWSREDVADVSIWSSSSQKRVDAAKASLKKFQESSARFLRETNLSAAEAACLQSRACSSVLLGAWIDLDPATRKAQSKLMADALAELSDRMMKSLGQIPKEDRGLLESYAKNIRERSGLFAALHSGGLPEGHRQLVAKLR